MIDTVCLSESDDLLVTDIVPGVWIIFGFIPLHKCKAVSKLHWYITVHLDYLLSFQE